jgi:hypothetical protein
VRTILSQTVASTHIDRNGERLTKAFLEKYAAAMVGAKHPLNSQHDLSRRTAGIENHRVVPDPSSLGEWLLLADVHLDEDVPIESFGGFSIAGIEMVYVPESADAKLLLGYPYYNDADLLRELAEDKRLALGKWIRKSAGELELGVLLGSLLAFLVTPIWEDMYTRKIAPRIDQLIDLYVKKIQSKGISAELLQVVGFNGSDVQVHFIPARSLEAKCLRSESVRQGLRVAIDFLQNDGKSNNVGARRIVLFYDEGKAGYALHRIEYSDGDIEHMV